MKNILLINPHIEDFSAYDHFSKPLGMLLLASYLKDNFNLHFINALNREHPSVQPMKYKKDGTGNFHKIIIPKPPAIQDIPLYFRRYGLEDADFTAELLKTPFKPDAVFVGSGMTYWYTGVKHTIQLIKKVFPKAPVVLGGIYASLLPEHAKKHSGADFIVNGQNISLVLPQIEAITNTRFPKNITKEIKTPAYELMGEYQYAPVYTSLGCIFNCDYCASSKLNTFQPFPPEKVADTIINLNRRYHVSHFAFYDDALLVNPEGHINIILEKIIKSGISVKFYTPNGTHIRFINEKTADLMKASGFVDIRLSLESSDPEFQKQEDGKTTNSEFESSVAILQKAGFTPNQLQVYTLANLPGQDCENIKSTMKFIHQTGATPRLAIYSPIPGTPDFMKANRITDVSSPLSQNNTVYAYRTGFKNQYFNELKALEQKYRYNKL